jgi:uncharacterized membrane protein required for colicin V production
MFAGQRGGGAPSDVSGVTAAVQGFLNNVISITGWVIAAALLCLPYRHHAFG